MAGLETVFHVDGSISIKGKNNVIMSGKSMNNLPNIKFKLNSQLLKTCANVCNSKCNYNLWHKRLGHISNSKFNELKN